MELSIYRPTTIPQVTCPYGHEDPRRRPYTYEDAKPLAPLLPPSEITGVSIAMRSPSFYPIQSFL